MEAEQPQVAYHETITTPLEDSYTHKKQSGGSGQFSMEISHHMPCPQNVAEQVIEEEKEKKAAK